MNKPSVSGSRLQSVLVGDLFCEGFEASVPTHGTVTHERLIGGIGVVYGEIGAGGERDGRYATVLCSELWKRDDATAVSHAVAASLEWLMGEAKPAVMLVCALGNPRITADALGTASAELIPAGVTPSGRVFVIKTGVPAATGIPTEETVRMFASHTGAELAVCIDSLAALSYERLGGVVQLTDCGISPGSGVSPANPAINAATVGVPVISVGIPTVIRTASGLICTCAATDELIRRGAAVIAGGLNEYLYNKGR